MAPVSRPPLNAVQSKRGTQAPAALREPATRTPQDRFPDLGPLVEGKVGGSWPTWNFLHGPPAADRAVPVRRAGVLGAGLGRVCQDQHAAIGCSAPGVPIGYELPHLAPVVFVSCIGSGHRVKNEQGSTQVLSCGAGLLPSLGQRGEVGRMRLAPCRAVTG